MESKSNFWKSPILQARAHHVENTANKGIETSTVIVARKDIGM
ncbi:hypothetical protein [Bacillus sp. ISL-7]|nr:hypothetical protein [Bacillus sp. ISL-7]